MQIASVFDAVYQVSAPKNTRLFLESIDYDAWGDPYGNWGMGTLLAPPLVPIRSPPRAPPRRRHLAATAAEGATAAARALARRLPPSSPPPPRPSPARRSTQECGPPDPGPHQECAGLGFLTPSRSAPA